MLMLALLLFGGALLVGGTQLLLIGGSPYYAVAGVVTLVSLALLWRGSARADRLFGLFVLGTVLWGLWEVGADGWSLAPRIGLPLALNLWFVMPWVRRETGAGRTGSRLPPASVTLLASIVTLAATAGFIAARPGASQPPAFPAARSVSAAMKGAGADWTDYGGTLAGQRFSGLDQINTANVGKLEPLWTYRTGDPGRSPEVTPLKIGDTLYGCTPHDIVYALDAETGKQRWRYDPKVDASQIYTIVCRGMSYHEQPGADAPCAKRLLVGTVDARLIALDAMTGRPCRDFGKAGTVNLFDGLGPVPPGFYYMTSPPTVAKGHVVVNAYIRDNQSTDEPSGVIRSFDPVTGALQWAWDMGAPDRIGAPPPGQVYTRDTPNSWAPLAADLGLNLVYVPTGNAPPDWYGGHRRPFDEKYASSLVALDLDTGRPRWSFQTTHHDIWDYDIPAQPVLVDLPFRGKAVPAVVQSTKHGGIYVLDRRTGRPLLPVIERAVPQGAAPGDRLSPTQPFPAIDVGPPRLTEASMWGVTPIDQMICRIRFRQSRYEGRYTPQGLTPAIIFPGSLGIVDWGGVAVDPDHGVVVVNSSAVPYRSQLIPRADAPAQFRAVQMISINGKPAHADNTWHPQIGTPFVARTLPFLGPLDVPCSAPPWGLLQAIDLRDGRTLWKRPLGTAEDSGPMDVPSRLPILMGVPNMGGSLVTRGGLIFNGATLDRYLRAYDLRSGNQLWQARLPAGGQATPMSYASRSGRQVVVISAGGHPGLRTRAGDYLLAFALPRK
jgi:membrane-bound PQQ-dependent dehydrogenase (glucose/quinate/shikimate family)